MNILKILICNVSLLGSLFVAAQTKESVTDLPYSNKFEISTKTLESLFQTSETVSMDLAPGFHIEGIVENKTEHTPAISSILIKLNNSGSDKNLTIDGQPAFAKATAGNTANGGILSITRYRDQNGKTYYSGQLLKLHESDGMLLVAEEQHYYFIETQQRFLVSE